MVTARSKRRRRRRGATKADRQRAFLAAIGHSANITDSAELVGINRDAHYDWMGNDPDYPAAFALALEEGGDRLESEARKRAVDGWREPVFQQGRRVGTILRKSDRMLELLLKGAKPPRNTGSGTSTRGPAADPSRSVPTSRT